MGPRTRSPELIEYIWPCGYHENVTIQTAPGFPFIPGKFPLPLAKPAGELTEYEFRGVPGRRRCCRCSATYNMFKAPDECEECEHSFQDGCADCVLVDQTGVREIATVDLR